MNKNMTVDRIYALNVIRLRACDNCKKRMETGETYYQVGIELLHASITAQALQYRYVCGECVKEYTKSP